VKFVPVPEPCRAAQARLIEHSAKNTSLRPRSTGHLPIGNEDYWQQLSFILDDRSQVEKLLVRLEELAKSR